MAIRRRTLVLTERALQGQLVDWLERCAGCTVLQLGQWKHASTCPACKHRHYPRSGWGSSTGAPDLLVFHPARVGWLLGLEVKTRTGAVKPRQRELAMLGATHIVRSLEEVVEVLLAQGLPVPVGRW